MNLRLMHGGQHLRVGEYTICQMKPIDGIDMVRIERKSGEEIEVSVEHLEEHLEQSLYEYFEDNM